MHLNTEKIDQIKKDLPNHFMKLLKEEALRVNPKYVFNENRFRNILRKKINLESFPFEVEIIINVSQNHKNLKNQLNKKLQKL